MNIRQNPKHINIDIARAEAAPARAMNRLKLKNISL